MNIKTTLKASVAAAALFAVAAPAQAGNVVSGNDNFTVKLSGQFNKAVLWADSGDSSNIAIGDNNTSRSRFWITPSGTVNEAVTVNGRFEIRSSSNLLSTATVADVGTNAGGNAGGDEATNFVTTETWMRINHKQAGSIQLGLGSFATDGYNEAVYNPAGMAVDSGDLAEGNAVELQASGAATNVFSGQTVSDFFASYQGGDSNNITYISPSFGGAKVHATYSTGGQASMAGYFGGKFGGFAVQGGVGYRNTSAASTTVDGVYGGSVGVKHDSGFSLSGGYSKEDAASGNAVEGKTWFVVAGYEASLVSAGKTGFAIQYLQSEDTTQDGDEGTLIAIGVNQGLATGVQVYAGAQFIEADRTATDYDDVTTVLIGSRISF